MSNDVMGIERVDPTPAADMFVATLKLEKIYGIYKQGKQLQREGKEIDFTIRLARNQAEIFGIERFHYLLMVQSMLRKGLLYDASMGYSDGSPYEVIGVNELGIHFFEYITYTYTPTP